MPDNESQTRWVIKLESGKQIGPFTTQAILKMIAEGAFIGGEQIKKFPDGKWNAISSMPDFYDKLLEVLEGEALKAKVTASSSKPIRAEQFDAETVIIRPPPKADSSKNESASEEDFNSMFDGAFEKNETNEDEADQFVQSPKKKLKSSVYSQHENLNANSVPAGVNLSAANAYNIVSTGTAKILLPQNSKSESSPSPTNAKKNVSFYFLLALIIITIPTVFWLMDDDGGVSPFVKPNLLRPKISSSLIEATVSGNEVKDKLRLAVANYVKDTFVNYQSAQSQLVSVIEGAPQNVEARGMLCLVYYELWPYVKQDSKDLETIGIVVKSTKNLDPVGINGLYCEMMRMLVQGKYQEARGVVEFALNQPAMSTAPVLYYLKADLLFEDRDMNTAVLYQEKAQQLWPDWVRPLYLTAGYYQKQGKTSQAVEVLKKVISKNPKHGLAQIDLGIILYESIHQTEEAFKLLSAALFSNEGKGHFPSGVEARARYYLAKIFDEKKNRTKALEEIQKAYALSPMDEKIKVLLSKLGGSATINSQSSRNNELVFLGDQHVRTGNCLSAQAEYKAAYDLDSTNAIAAMKAAQCLWKLNQSNEAIQWLNKAIKADGKLVGAYVLQADYFSERSNYVPAMQILNKASQKFPNNYEVLRGYGLVEYRRNNIKDAVGYLERSYKMYENDSETLILLAKAHIAARNYQSAQKYAVRAIELDATNSAAQIVYARVLTQFQGLETGLVYLKDLLNKFSYTIDFRLAMADLNRENERYSQAQKIYEQIVDADPKNKKARLGLGECYQAQAIFDKALKEYLNATVLDPSDAEGLFRAGTLYLDIGKFKDAITQFRRAAIVNGLYPRLNYFVGRAYFLNGEYEAALASSMEERKLNPNIADSYILAAEVYSATKQFQKCAGEYQQAIKVRNQGADLYVKAARCYRQSGSPDIAESMLNIASSQESGYAEIYKEMGAIYETKGDMRAAVASYNKYLALSPNAPDQKEIEARILQISRGK